MVFGMWLIPIWYAKVESDFNVTGRYLKRGTPGHLWPGRSKGLMGKINSKICKKLRFFIFASPTNGVRTNFLRGQG
jgi:hypothetical protein